MGSDSARLKPSSKAARRRPEAERDRERCGDEERTRPAPRRQTIAKHREIETKITTVHRSQEKHDSKNRQVSEARPAKERVHPINAQHTKRPRHQPHPAEHDKPANELEVLRWDPHSRTRITRRTRTLRQSSRSRLSSTNASRGTARRTGTACSSQREGLSKGGGDEGAEDEEAAPAHANNTSAPPQSEASAYDETAPEAGASPMTSR